MVRRSRLRHSLLVRLVATSVVIAVCSIVATAWLAVQGTTSAIEEAQGQALSDDATIYDGLLGYAAGHRSWAGVENLLQDLSRRTGRQITLTTQNRAPIARYPAKQDKVPQKASALVNPLLTDPQLKPGTPSRIDPRAVGPYLLTASEREDMRAEMQAVQRCVTDSGLVTATLVTTPSGRTDIVVNAPREQTTFVLDDCRLQVKTAGQPLTERNAYAALQKLLDGCLKAAPDRPVAILTEKFNWLRVNKLDTPTDAQIQECIDSSRREQLKAHVAPSALLFVRSPGGTGKTSFDLSRANVTRIAGVTALILAITLLLTVLLAVRLVRPLRALTAAARHPTGEHVRVKVQAKDEIGVLAEAFNDLSDRRQRAEEQRQAMVRDVAHELRTPLTNIRAWLEASEDGLAGPTGDPALTAALLREALQLQSIIEDLSDLAAADAGELRLRPEPVQVRELLDHITTAHEGAADAAGVTLGTRTLGDPVLNADAVRLRQALGNLVSNAVRYTPRGGHVTVRASEDGPDVVIEVADTGVGIAADDLPHVFDRFWRADVSRTRDTGGSGLGLSIVRQIADLHGGSVSVASEPGHGARFTLRIPAQAPSRPAPE